VYIALLISNFKDNSPYSRELFASLREHDYNKLTSEVHFKNSNITLQIFDAEKGAEWIHMDDPRKLFTRHYRKLYTTVLYYKDNDLHRLGPKEIGFVHGLSTKKKKCVENICSIQLKSGDGKPVHRVISKAIISMNLVSEVTVDVTGRQWVTSWRQFREGDLGLPDLGPGRLLRAYD
jgi:hypothetical protein